MKALNSSLKHFLVQKAQISNKAAVEQILAGKVLVNGIKGRLNQVLQPEDEVRLAGQVLKEPQAFIYLAYYKPRGIESTLNPLIQDNLLQALNINQSLFPVGRLDKDSEGLMLLTNDGRIFDQLIHADSHQEKEYLVRVDKPLSQQTLDTLAAGVVIMGERTRPALVTQVAATSFKIILTQGRNRQIRRMCYKLGYQVVQLIRLRLSALEPGELKPGEWRYLNKQEISDLHRSVSA